jgi:hypothetical protein
MCGCYIFVVLVQIVQIPVFVCIDHTCEFSDFRCSTVPTVQCHVPSLLCVPAWPLFNTPCPWMAGGGESLTSCCVATLWVHTSSNSAPFYTQCMHRSTFSGGLPLRHLDPWRWDHTPFQIVGTKEPMPCGNSEEWRFRDINAWQVKHFNLMHSVDIVDIVHGQRFWSSVFKIVSLPCVVCLHPWEHLGKAAVSSTHS